MKILAIIPARAGSKRLPNKNKLHLGGKPLVIWSIDSVRGVESICDILVSTDDPEIAEICKNHGALVPWLRPPELATDDSHVVDTLIHGVDWYEGVFGEVDGILLLQPTSPFRRKETIDSALRQFSSGGCLESVVGVSKVKTHPDWCFHINKSGALTPWGNLSGATKRAQDLVPVFGLNGLVYVMNPRVLRDRKMIVGEKTVGCVVEAGIETLDIDTGDDFELAKFYLIKNVGSQN